MRDPGQPTRTLRVRSAVPALLATVSLLLLASGGLARERRPIERPGVPGAAQAAPVQTASALTLSRTDAFVVALSNVNGIADPRLLRVDVAGNVLWHRSLPFQTFYLPQGDSSAGRNQMEDSLYLIPGDNRTDGLRRVQKYNALGNLVWDVPLSPDTFVLSPDPVAGGVWAADYHLGVYRLDGNGNVLWGPRDYGSPGSYPWAVAVDVTTGEAFVSHNFDGEVLKVDPEGDVIWARSIPEVNRVDANPVDGGVYVMSGAGDSYHLDAEGNTVWSTSCFPSCTTYSRTVSPVDGSLYVVGGFPSLLGKVAMDGTVLWTVQNDDYAGHTWCNSGLAADAEADAFYCTQNYLDLGVDRRSGADAALLWRLPNPAGYTPVEGYENQHFAFVGAAADSNITVTYPLDGDVTCSDPPPTITWTPGIYNRFKVFIAVDPTFSIRVSSGDTVLKTTAWTVPAKKWRTICRRANPSLYLKVRGKVAGTKTLDESETRVITAQ